MWEWYRKEWSDISHIYTRFLLIKILRYSKYEIILEALWIFKILTLSGGGNERSGTIQFPTWPNTVKNIRISKVRIKLDDLFMFYEVIYFPWKCWPFVGEVQEGVGPMEGWKDSARSTPNVQKRICSKQTSGVRPLTLLRFGHIQWYIFYSHMTEGIKIRFYCITDFFNPRM